MVFSLTKKYKIRFITDITVGIDVNIIKKFNLKHDNYMQLSSELKRLYLKSSFKIVPSVSVSIKPVKSDLEKKWKSSLL